MNNKSRNKTDGMTSLERARLAAGLSKNKLAKMAGMQTCQLARYDKGRARPSKQVAGKIAAALGRPVRDVFPEYDSLTDCTWGRWAPSPVNSNEEKSIALCPHCGAPKRD